MHLPYCVHYLAPFLAFVCVNGFAANTVTIGISIITIKMISNLRRLQLIPLPIYQTSNVKVKYNLRRKILFQILVKLMY